MDTKVNARNAGANFTGSRQEKKRSGAEEKNTLPTKSFKSRHANRIFEGSLGCPRRNMDNCMKDKAGYVQFAAGLKLRNTEAKLKISQWTTITLPGKFARSYAENATTE